MKQHPGHIITEIPPDIAELLNREAARINSVKFIESDPVQFPRRFSRLEDIEVVAIISAIIAWGRRPMICRNAERILSLMDYDPYNYVMDEGYEDLPADMNLHRTFFARNLQYLLRGLRRIFKKYGSIDAFASACRVGESEAPAWLLVENLQKVMSEENGGMRDARCFPVNLRTTALKRINMALRWLVRDDGIVDLGVWKSISKSKLFIPMDVHVRNTAADLGLLTRKQADRKNVELLTALLRTLRPDDPAYYDYALFGIGIEGNASLKS